jgi:uroporphyrinogen-III synthase
MPVLVTRPHPDDETTAAALRARGFEVLLAPMLRFEPVAFHEDLDARYGAVVVTSANALRGIELKGHRLLELPLFAVGEQTASAARHAGFTHVFPASGDAEGLRDLVLARVKAKELKKASTLLYLAGADLARDLAGEAFAASAIGAVLHYSRRSARAFLDAARAGGVEISALSIPQCCISASVASVVREAGATQVMVAATPDENALFEVLERALRA